MEKIKKADYKIKRIIYKFDDTSFDLIFKFKDKKLDT